MWGKSLGCNMETEINLDRVGTVDDPEASHEEVKQEDRVFEGGEDRCQLC